MKKRKKKRVGKWLLLFLASCLCLGLMGCGTASSDVADRMENMVTGNHPLEVKSVSQDKYAYNTLDDATKVVYDEILYTIVHQKKEAQIATTDIDQMELAYQAVRYDYCNLFWLEQFSYITYNRDDEITAIVITPEYSMTKEEQKETQKKIDEEADRMLADAPKDGSDYDKALYVFKKLIEEVDYVEDSEDNQNIISVFLNHETICQGYAYATQYLLEKLGISCTTVIGNVTDGPHAWNLAKLDGSYYYIDTTWGNSQYFSRQSDQKTTTVSKYVDYNYFGATTADIMQSHTPDSRIALPECTDPADNYYVHENRYITEWNPDVIGDIFCQAYEQKEDMVQVKFASVDLYEQAMQYFVEEYGIASYCPGLSQFHYMEDIEGCVLFIAFDN